MRSILLSLFLLLGFIFWNAASAFPESIIGSGCSVSKIGYLSELVKEYEMKTGAKVFVRGGGSVVGLEDLHSGRVDFATSCRNREPDDPEDIQFIQVAWDALVFITHKSNPIDNISPADIRSIYEGKTINWRQLKGNDMPIKIFLSKPQKGLSGVEASLEAMVLKGELSVKTKNTILLPSSGIVEQMVEKTPEGFATTGFSSARKRNLKMLNLDGISPTKENIIKNKYPFRRPLFILIHKNHKPEIKRFIDFILSKEGQQIISSQGAVSLLDIK